MEKSQGIIVLVFKALAVSMAVASVVISILTVAPDRVSILLLGIGLFSVSVAILPKPAP